MKIIKKILFFSIKHCKVLSFISRLLLFAPLVFTVFFGIKHIDLIWVADSDPNSDFLIMFTFGALVMTSLFLPSFVLLDRPLDRFLDSIFTRFIKEEDFK